MERKLSDQIKRCLDFEGCKECKYVDGKQIMSCRELLEEVYDEIKRYEDMFPCEIGDKVYWLNNWFVGRASGILNQNWHITESKVLEFRYTKFGTFINLENGEDISVSEIGKTLFFNKGQAEAELKKKEEKEEQSYKTLEERLESCCCELRQRKNCKETE